MLSLENPASYQEEEEEARVERPSQRACERESSGVGLSTYARAYGAEVPTKKECEWSWRGGEDAVPLSTDFLPFSHPFGWARGRAFVAQNSRYLFKWVDATCKRIYETRNMRS